MRGAGGGALCLGLPDPAPSLGSCAASALGSVPQPGRLGAAPAMSRVRLSNGSPTLERMEARQADYPKPSACRNLFGPVDHDELARELQRHRRDLAEASRRKWNFDFQRHQPLDGRYEWQAVARDALPDFYSRPPRLRGALAKPDGDRRSQRRAAAQDPPGSDGPDAPREPAAPGAGPRKRPAADPDDSSHQSKRANATEVISEDSPSDYSVEQTPKKSSPRRHQT